MSMDFNDEFASCKSILDNNGACSSGCSLCFFHKEDSCFFIDEYHNYLKKPYNVAGYNAFKLKTVKRILAEKIDTLEIKK